MQALSELAPLLAFVVAYFLGGLYVATAVLMAAMLLVIALDWLRLKRIPPMHALSTVLVLVFGGATLLLHDKTFIQWKPTVFFWLASIAFVASFWIGERTLAERMLASALQESLGQRLQVSPAQWRLVNFAWVLFAFLLGALNLVVVLYLSERVWVALKPVDAVLMALFMVAQVLWLATRRPATQAQPSA